jgi:hypothetical protein
VPSEERETFGFIHDFQKLIIAAMLFDGSSFMINMVMREPDSFDSKVLGNMATVIIDLFKEQEDRVPSEIEFLEGLQTFFNTNKYPDDERDKYANKAEEIFSMGQEAQKTGVESYFKPVKDKVVDFMRIQAAEKAIEDGTRSRNYGTMVIGIEKALLIGKDVADLGIVYGGENWEERLELRSTTLNRKLRGIPTGFFTIDKWLRGGICPQEMGIIMGYTGTGKTTVVINAVKGALNRGIDVVHYTFEVNEEMTEEIYDASITGIAKENLDDERETVRQRKKEFLARPGMGRLIIKSFEAKSNPRMIESHLHQLKFDIDIDPGLLVADYLGLMRPSDKSVKHESRYTLFGEIMLELKAIAQRGDYAIWVVYQTIKGTRYQKIVTMEDAADSQEVMRHADIVLSICQTTEEEKMKPEVFRIYGAKGKNVPAGWEEKFEIDRDKALIWEFETRKE